MATITREHVANLYQSVQQKIEAWEASIDPKVRWRGGERKAIAGNLIEAWHALFDAVATLDAEQNAKPAILVIDEFESILEEWAEGCDLQPETTDPRRTSQLWSKWGEIAEAFNVPKRRQPESIKTLTVEKVPDRQIALIYGFFRADGEADAEKVREERDNPGTHYNPETWIHPDEAKRNAAINKRWQLRQARIDTRAFESQGVRDAPETTEELIRQRVPSKQIAEMKRCSVEDVQTLAAKLGIPLDGQFVPSISPADKMQDIRQAELDRDAELERLMASNDTDELAKQLASDGEATTLLERVLESHIAGNSHEDIAKGLKPEFKKITAAKVAKMIESATSAAIGTSGI